MKSIRILPLLAVALLAVACASGPKHSDVVQGMPGLKANEGRVFVYRDSSMFGAALQPTVYVNGKASGDSKPGGFFYVDLPAGPVEVTTGTEVDKKATFMLGAREVRYVKTSVGLGILVGRVYPELVDEKTGSEEIKGTSFTGKPATAQ